MGEIKLGAGDIGKIYLGDKQLLTEDIDLEELRNYMFNTVVVFNKSSKQKTFRLIYPEVGTVRNFVAYPNKVTVIPWDFSSKKSLIIVDEFVDGGYNAIYSGYSDGDSGIDSVNYTVEKGTVPFIFLVWINE